MFNMFILFFALLLSSTVNVFADIVCGQSNQHPSNKTQCTPNSETRVIGGQCADPGQFPWVVQVDLKIYGRRIGFCGGSIIDKYTIMTAAHCTKICPPFAIPGFPVPGIPVQEYNISVGERNLKDPNDGQKYYVSTKAIVHKNYSACSDSYGNDIALLKLAGDGLDVPYFSDNGLGSTNIICQPSASTNYTGKDVITAGWGRTNKNNDDTAKILQFATIQVVDDSRCSKTYPDSYDPKTMICAFAPGKSSCNGDSGTALFTPSADGVFAQAVGITSYGRQNCEGHEVVYTRVSNYLDFINANLGPSTSG